MSLAPACSSVPKEPHCPLPRTVKKTPLPIAPYSVAVHQKIPSTFCPVQCSGVLNATRCKLQAASLQCTSLQKEPHCLLPPVVQRCNQRSSGPHCPLYRGCVEKEPHYPLPPAVWQCPERAQLPIAPCSVVVY